MRFIEQDAAKKLKTRIWSVESDKKVVVGSVKFNPHYHQYVFESAAVATFHPVDLRDIRDFCEAATVVHKGDTSSVNGWL